MISESGGDEIVATSTAPGGVPASRVCPSTVTPAFCSAARNAPVAKSGGLSATSEYLSGPEFAPMVPRTEMPPSERRDAQMLLPEPPTSRTLFSSGIVVDAGSSATDALPFSGRTATQMRFSSSDSADTRAAYEAPR